MTEAGILRPYISWLISACYLQGFVREASRSIVIDAVTPDELLNKMAVYKPPPSLLSIIKEGKLDRHIRG